MTKLTGWQAVAREIGDYDMKNAWGTILTDDLEPRTDDFIGQWLPAEAAAKEILRLRERVEVLEKSIRWALGEVDMDGWFQPQGPSEPRYWWRSGLSRRAALADAKPDA